MWTEGRIKAGNSTFTYWAKHFDEASEEYGINGGRISKLTIKRDGRIVYNYDRGLDIEPADKDTDKALATLIRQYN